MQGGGAVDDDVKKNKDDSPSLSINSNNNNKDNGGASADGEEINNRNRGDDAGGQAVEDNAKKNNDAPPSLPINSNSKVREDNLDNNQIPIDDDDVGLDAQPLDVIFDIDTVHYNDNNPVEVIGEDDLINSHRSDDSSDGFEMGKRQ